MLDATLQAALQAAARGDLEQAYGLFQRAVELSPSDCKLRYNLATAALKVGYVEEALAHFDALVAQAPDYVAAHSNRGIALHQLGRLTEACESFQQALSIDASFVDAHYNLGHVYGAMERFSEAIGHYEMALALRPHHADACCARGHALSRLAQYAQAELSFEQALAIDPLHGTTRLNLGLLRLLTGQWQSGWALFEERLKRPEAAWLGRYQPRWDRAKTDGKVLVLCEEGYGDTLQFMRYLERLSQRVSQIRLITPEPLRKLIQDSCPDVVVGAAAHEDACLSYVPLMSLPYVLGDNGIQAAKPYLRVDQKRSAAMAQLLGRQVSQRIGLAWRGSARHPHDRHRSLTAKQLGLMLQEGPQYVSLQVDLDEAEESLLGQCGVVNLKDHIQDFADTAALMECLNLVISVDTSVAHLAGAMGKPTWVLLPFVPDWRWQLEREDSPWYPTMKLYRQPKRGDWDSVLERVRVDLATHFGTSGTPTG